MTAPSSQGNLRKVAPGLLVGDAFAVLHAPRCAVILDVFGSSECLSPGDPRAPVYRATRVLCRPFDDGEQVPRATMALAWLNYRSCNGVMLIHCAAGLSRSASIAYGLIRRAEGVDHIEALRRVETPGGRGRYPVVATLQSVREWVRERK